MTSHDPRLLGLLYLVSTSDSLADAGSKASLVFFGISASIFLECAYALGCLLWPQRRRTDDDDIDRRPPQRYVVNTIEKKLQLLLICLLFVLGMIVITVDIWAGSKAAVQRAMSEALEMDGARARAQTAFAKMGVVAFWLSSWVGGGFMIYRTYLVYATSKWRWHILAGVALVYISSIVTGILSLVKSSFDDAQLKITSTALVLTAASNLIFTSSICVRLYQYWRGVCAQIPEALKGRAPVRVIWDAAYDTTSVLVESSALCAALSVTFAGLFAAGHESTRLMFPVLCQIQVLSPLLIGYHICKDTAWTGKERIRFSQGRESRLPTATGSVVLDTYHTGPISLRTMDFDSRHEASRIYSINVVPRSRG